MLAEIARVIEDLARIVTDIATLIGAITSVLLLLRFRHATRHLASIDNAVSGLNRDDRVGDSSSDSVPDS